MRVETSGGSILELGTTETTPTIGIIDYSRRVTDDFGVTTVVKRGFSRRLSVRMAVPFDDVDLMQGRLADLRAEPALWIADDRFQWLAVQGFYKDFEVDLAIPPTSFCRLSVEGLAETEVVPDPGGDPAPPGQASTLKLLQPSDGSPLVASDVPEADFPEWAAGTTYAAGAHVIKAATHRIYESIAGGNLGNDPAIAFDKWIDIGPTNRWAMFDQSLGTATTAAGLIVVQLAAATALALLDVVAATVRVQATGYDQTLAPTNGTVTFLDLPPAGGTITATITGAGTISVGTLVIGSILLLGVTEASPSAGITDYSRKVVDDFGEVTVVQRAWAKRMTAKALIDTDMIDRVANRIASVRGRPSLWIGQAGLNALTIYGFFKEFSIEVGETVSKLSLSIEGLSKAPPLAAAPEIALIDWNTQVSDALPMTRFGTSLLQVRGSSVEKMDGDGAFNGGLIGPGHAGHLFIEARFTGLVPGAKFADIALDLVGVTEPVTGAAIGMEGGADVFWMESGTIPIELEALL